jgi:hypothetical protein
VLFRVLEIKDVLPLCPDRLNSGAAILFFSLSAFNQEMVIPHD